jgi:hypothetical protein
MLTRRGLLQGLVAVGMAVGLKKVAPTSVIPPALETAAPVDNLGFGLAPLKAEGEPIVFDYSEYLTNPRTAWFIKELSPGINRYWRRRYSRMSTDWKAFYGDSND